MTGRVYLAAVGRIAGALGVAAAVAMTAGAFGLALVRQPPAAILAGVGFLLFAGYMARYGWRPRGGTGDRVLGTMIAAGLVALTANAWGVF